MSTSIKTILVPHARCVFFAPFFLIHTAIAEDNTTGQATPGDVVNVTGVCVLLFALLPPSLLFCESANRVIELNNDNIITNTRRLCHWCVPPFSSDDGSSRVVHWIQLVPTEFSV